MKVPKRKGQIFTRIATNNGHELQPLNRDAAKSKADLVKMPITKIDLNSKIVQKDEKFGASLL